MSFWTASNVMFYNCTIWKKRPNAEKKCFKIMNAAVTKTVWKSSNCKLILKIPFCSTHWWFQTPSPKFKWLWETLYLLLRDLILTEMRKFWYWKQTMCKNELIRKVVEQKAFKWTNKTEWIYLVLLSKTCLDIDNKRVH